MRVAILVIAGIIIESRQLFCEERENSQHATVLHYWDTVLLYYTWYHSNVLTY